MVSFSWYIHEMEYYAFKKNFEVHIISTTYKQTKIYVIQHALHDVCEKKNAQRILKGFETNHCRNVYG